MALIKHSQMNGSGHLMSLKKKKTNTPCRNTAQSSYYSYAGINYSYTIETVIYRKKNKNKISSGVVGQEWRTH